MCQRQTEWGCTEAIFSLARWPVSCGRLLGPPHLLLVMCQQVAVWSLGVTARALPALWGLVWAQGWSPPVWDLSLQRSTARTESVDQPSPPRTKLESFSTEKHPEQCSELKTHNRTLLWVLCIEFDFSLTCRLLDLSFCSVRFFPPL